MFQLAIDARIPIIKITTNDLVNLQAVLDSHIDGEFLTVLSYKDLMRMIPHNEFLYIVSPDDSYHWETVYAAVAHHDNECCIVVVNPDEDSPSFFDAGELTAPKKMLRVMLLQIAPKEVVPNLLRALSGTNLKEASEICKIAMAMHDELTSFSIASARRHMPISFSGLSLVDTDYSHYTPDENLDEWIENDGHIFMMNGGVPFDIVPRGLLFRGASGTGKTMAAKYIANCLGLSLYRLDIAASLNKYIGQSEGNVRVALERVEQLAPCILLMDEIEKLFRGNDDTGVAGRILSTLLWWMQERKARVLTVMTSNDADAVPIELLREGRIDRDFTLKGLSDPEDHLDFMTAELEGLNAGEECIAFAFESFDSLDLEWSQAALAAKAHEYMRKWLLMKGENDE